MLGAYPRQNHCSMCYSRVGEEENVMGITKLDWFHQDPLLFGTDEPALHV